jgi:hypothetical protein
MPYLNLDYLSDTIIKHLQINGELQSITILNESSNDTEQAIRNSYFQATTTCVCIHSFMPASIVNNCPGPLFPKLSFSITITAPVVGFIKRVSPTEIAQKICNALHFQTIQSDGTTFFILLKEKEFWKSEHYFFSNRPTTIELKFTALPQDV